jgi:iron(III) transport system ATP-binding protein
MTMSFLDIQSVTKTYGAMRALGGVNLNVPVGSRTAIVGPSGSGKTTLLRIIAGFEVPDTGRVSMGGQVLAEGSNAVPAHRRGIGFVPQDGALFPHLNVADNIGFGLARNDPGRQQRIAELMDMVSLDKVMLTRRPHELSGGQQQRVALARALALRPKLMLLDEPFSALDTGLRAATRKAVAQLLTSAGITSILVTHDQAEALSFADQVAVMRGGLLAQVGPPSELYLRPVDAATAGFLGEAVVLPAQLSGGWAECVLGRVPVTDKLRSGEANIMVRPEQLEWEDVAPASQGAVDVDLACYGTVTDVDYGGPICGLTVHLKGADVDTAPLLVRSHGIEVPAVGATVRISVRGQAHVFAGP